MPILLDTNIVIALFAKEESVIERVDAAEDIAVCSVVLGELYFGARKSGKVEQNLARVDDFARSNHIFFSDNETSKLYGIIKAQLLTLGRPIPENDIWIAALALQHSAALATRDSHFHNIENLEVVEW